MYTSWEQPTGKFMTFIRKEKNGTKKPTEAATSYEGLAVSVKDKISTDQGKICQFEEKLTTLV